MYQISGSKFFRTTTEIQSGPDAFDESSFIKSIKSQEFLGNDELFYFISIYKFGSFKNPFAMITSLAELYFRFRRFTLLVEI